MKESRYNPLQVTSLLAVLVLQVFWVGNAYVQRAQKLGMVCDNVLKQAVDSSGNSTSLGRLHNEVGRLLDRERVDCAYVLLQFDLTHNTIVGQSRDVGIPPVGAVMSGGLSLPDASASRDAGTDQCLCQHSGKHVAADGCHAAGLRPSHSEHSGTDKSH